MTNDLTSRTSAFNAALESRYRIERELGSGGMATVYLAEDLKHHRKVAMKVLHAELSAVLGPDRFLAEIRTTANLQHPHILPLFDSGSANGLLYYVMPYVDGETLRARLARETQLPIDDALRIATEVADALAYAHGRGVIHRDIKPENILLQNGHALVADFGIALAVEHAGGARVTQTGLSLGTPQYMAPEQAAGERTLDARADVYALGAVTYEMIAGEPPFTGPNAQAILAQVITAEPKPLVMRRRSVSENVDAAVLRALEKLPADRFADVRDYAAALVAEGVGAQRRRGRPMKFAARITRERVAVAALMLVAVGALGGALIARRVAASAQSAVPPARFVLEGIHLGGGPGSGLLALSPDGRSVVYLGDASLGSSLWVRRIDESQATMLPDTREAYDVTFSPDGRSIVFTRANKAYRLLLAGGSPILIPGLRAYGPLFVWLRDHTLVYQGDDGALYRIPEAGGTATRIVALDSAANEQRETPSGVLADDRHLLVLGASTNGANRLYVFDLSTGRRTTVMESGVSAARFLPPNHIVYTDQHGVLLSVPFDPRDFRVTGPAARLADAISNTTGGAARFATSDVGSLVYAVPEPADVVLVDRTGASRVVSDAPRAYHNPRFSPDGRSILVDVQSTDGDRDAWILDVEQHSLTRATFAGDGHDAIWSRDGRSIFYMSQRPGSLTAFRIAVAGDGSAAQVVSGHGLNNFTDVAPDGTLIGVGASRTQGSDWDLVAARPGDTLRDVLTTRFAEAWPSLSPDGTWLAYASNESARPEVYVRRLDGVGGRLQVSLDGGTEPVWNKTGHDLFYRRLTDSGSELMMATFVPSPGPRIEGRRSLFNSTGYDVTVPHSDYDVSPDGQHFVMSRPTKAVGLVYLQNVPVLAGGAAARP